MVNPATFFVVALIIYQILHAKDLKTLSFHLFLDGIVFALLAGSGYFIKFGSLTLEYEEVLMLCYIVVFIASGGMKKDSHGLVLKAIVLLVVTAVGLYILVLAPKNVLVMPVGGSWDQQYLGRFIFEPLAFSTKNAERFFRLILVTIVAIGVSDLVRKKEFRSSLIKSIIMITLIQTIIGYLDIGTKMLLNRPVLQLITTSFLGTGVSQFGGIAMRGGSYLIQGFMREPSHFAVSFVPGLTILALLKEKSLSTQFLEVASIVILVLSTSFAGFGIVFYWLMLKLWKYVIEHRRGKIISIAIVVITLSFLIGVLGLLSDLFPLVHYYISRLSGLIGIGPAVGSESIRLLSVQSSLDLMFRRPIFGLGLGSTNAHGFLPSLLANIGLAGFIAWIVFFVDALGMKQASFVPLLLWLFLGMLIGDIGWLYNMMGLAMVIGVACISYSGDKLNENSIDEHLPAA
ncbi:hypothetical protein V512_004535 [Mesotoga sp. Brook.08.105.5.1]|uniref:hypothetical protein n=1 Tax=Mesotoga sp. Brook.08.105.5.1 TaxID=1421002 RepID=UPI000C196B0C|nr:hypothetical protein [Mesotoga sp. Brook.08.105.5.1]PVD16200.1 hypothetical protein V512_004535 [Mesotoga sp. Brook.08.105.5.1]